MSATMFCFRKKIAILKSVTFLLFYMSNVVLLSLNTHKLINGCTTFRLNPFRRMDNSSNTTIGLKKGLVRHYV